MRLRLVVFSMVFFASVVFAAGRGRGIRPEVPKASEPGIVPERKDVLDSNGPTVLLACHGEGALKNSTEDFMYFVPLISPVKVTGLISENNQQRSGIISCVRQADSGGFSVVCEFQMNGAGFYKNVFDSAGMISWNKRGAFREGEPMKNILDYIKFDGEGFGKVEVFGTIDNGKAEAEEVRVHFNGRDGVSPVTVGLYSVKPLDGEYEYSSRYNAIVARVDTLTFRKSDLSPRMGIEISSLYEEGSSNGFWSRVKGRIANLFIKPLEIDRQGNETMLDFGEALFGEEKTFTFPAAEKLRPVADK